MTTMGRPRKIEQKVYDDAVRLLEGNGWGDASERTVRNWISVEPLFNVLVKELGEETVNKYFISEKTGKVAMRLLLAIHRKIPPEMYVPVSKSVIEYMDRGVSTTHIVDNIGVHFIFSWSEISKETQEIILKRSGIDDE